MRKLRYTAGVVGAALVGALCVPAAVAAVPELDKPASSASADSAYRVTDNGDGDEAGAESGESGEESEDDTPREKSSPESTRPKEEKVEKGEKAEEAPAANVPDPTDFDNIKQDPDDYLVPKSADVFKQSDGTYAIPAPKPGGQAAGAVVPGLEAYASQKVDWVDCTAFDPAGGDAYSDAGTNCAYVIVPLDYNNPTGPTIAVGLLRVPAQDQAHKKGSIFADPGGPGSSGFSTAQSFAGTDINKDFDIIGIAPRGVGESLPAIRCESNAAMDVQRQGSDELSAEKFAAVLKHNTQDCYNYTGKLFGLNGKDFIGAVGTRNVVKDLDIARSVVGDSKLNYVGFSYGTSIGYHYAKQFPDNLRAVVIDGVVNPFENAEENGAPFYEKYGPDPRGQGNSDLLQLMGFQGTFDQFLKKCAADDGFEVQGAKIPCALGTSGDLKEMMKNYQAISQRAWGAQTYKADDGRPVSFADFNQATILAMYSESLWPVLNAGLAAAKDSTDATIMMSLADSYASRDSNGQYAADLSAFKTIWCNDSGEVLPNDPDQFAKDKLLQFEKAPFTDPGKSADGTQRGLVNQEDWCTYFETKGTLPKGEDLSGSALPNILTISTAWDSATPFQNGVWTAAALGGTLLISNGASHTSYNGRHECVDQITNTFFRDLTVPTDIPGKQNVQTKDIYSKVVTGNECTVVSFRPTPALAEASGAPGETVDISATGLVRNTNYTVTLPEGLSTEEPAVTADEKGDATFSVTIGEKVSVGDYEIQLLPEDPSANDPTVKPVGKLTVTKMAPTPAATPSPTDTSSKTPANNNTPANDSKGTTKPADLAKTGVDTHVLLFSTLLMSAAAGTLALRRKLSTQK